MLTVLGNYSESELTRHFMTQMSHDETRADGSLNEVTGEDVTWFVSGLCDVAENQIYWSNFCQIKKKHLWAAESQLIGRDVSL